MCLEITHYSSAHVSTTDQVMRDFEAHASAHFERHPLKGRHSFQEGPFPVFWATSGLKSDKAFDLKAMCFVAQHTYNAQPPSHAPCVCFLTRVPNSCRRHKRFSFIWAVYQQIDQE